MNPRITAVAAGVGLAVFAAVFLLQRAPSPEPPPEAPPPVEAADPGSTGDAAPASIVPGLVRPETLEAESIEAMRQRVKDLELALEATIDMRNEAVVALEASERDIEKLEAFVEEIEARGEDPADYAGEAMEQFQPAFFRFEDASAAFERAELLEQAAREELAKARAELAALEAGGAER